MRFLPQPTGGSATTSYASIALLLLAGASLATAQDSEDTSAVQSSASSSAPSNTRPTNSQSSTAARTTNTASDQTTASTTPRETINMSSAPSITTTKPNAIIHLTNLPTLAGAGIPTVIVPDLSKAAFMQKSNLPEGTVFICVGAALGFFGACILAWRALVAYALHKSVKRAAAAQNTADTKAALRGPGGGYGYSAAGASSTLSLDQLSTPNNKSKLSKAYTPPIGSQDTQSRSSLFFSPTAANNIHQNGNRSSGYLPAGYYANGNSAPAPVSHLGSNTASTIPSLLGRGPAAAGYTRTSSLGPSPPVSPLLGATPSRTNLSQSPYDRPPPSRGGDSIGNRNSAVSGVYHQGLQSTSSLNLNVPPQGRAPSAYLEDLFENHGSGPRERF